MLAKVYTQIFERLDKLSALIDRVKDLEGKIDTVLGILQTLPSEAPAADPIIQVDEKTATAMENAGDLKPAKPTKAGKK